MFIPERVVGYYSPVHLYNKGKQEEYHNRRTMSPDELSEYAQPGPQQARK
jgi:hypothetical protein